MVDFEVLYKHITSNYILNMNICIWCDRIYYQLIQPVKCSSISPVHPNIYRALGVFFPCQPSHGHRSSGPLRISCRDRARRTCWQPRNMPLTKTQMKPFESSVSSGKTVDKHIIKKKTLVKFRPWVLGRSLRSFVAAGTHPQSIALCFFELGTPKPRWTWLALVLLWVPSCARTSYFQVEESFHKHEDGSKPCTPVSRATSGT